MLIIRNCHEERHIELLNRSAEWPEIATAPRLVPAVHMGNWKLAEERLCFQYSLAKYRRIIPFFSGGGGGGGLFFVFFSFEETYLFFFCVAGGGGGGGGSFSLDPVSLGKPSTSFGNESAKRLRNEI